MVVDVMKSKNDSNFTSYYLIHDFNSRKRTEPYEGEAFLQDSVKKIIKKSVANNFAIGNRLTDGLNLSEISDLMICIDNAIIDIINDNNFFIPSSDNKSYFYIKTSLYYISSLSFEIACARYLYPKLNNLFNLNEYFIRRVTVIISNILEDIIKEPCFLNILSTSIRDKKVDSTNLSHMNHETHWVMRCAILIEIKNGLNNSAISRNLHVNRRTVADIRDLYEKDKYIQFSDLKLNKPGQKENPYKRIPKEVHGQLVRDLEKSPSSFGINSSTWTASAIKEYLEKAHNITVPLYYIYSFCHRNNITSKFARRVNPKQDIELKKNFIKNRYRDICKEALLGGYEIVFGDETCVVRKHNKKGFAPKGNRARLDYTEQVKHTGAGLFTLMSPSGIFKSFSYFDTFNSKMFIGFITDFHNMFPDKKFIIILDNARWHKSKIVKEWLNGLREKNNLYLRFEWLPAYCPEINPVEYFNNDFKHYISKFPSENKVDVILDADNYFFDLNNDLNEKDRKIKSFFLGEGCCYSMMVYHEVLESLGMDVA